MSSCVSRLPLIVGVLGGFGLVYESLSYGSLYLSLWALIVGGLGPILIYGVLSYEEGAMYKAKGADHDEK